MTNNGGCVTQKTVGFVVMASMLLNVGEGGRWEYAVDRVGAFDRGSGVGKNGGR